LAISHSAILERAKVPAREALQEALQGLKFKLSVDEAYEPFGAAGYLPCTLNGEDGGLDLRFEPAEAYLSEHPELKAEAGMRDILIGLRSGGDPREDVCALMLSAALAHDFGAIVVVSKKGTVIPVEQLLSRARSQFAELE
jgi:hypothetical protein